MKTWIKAHAVALLLVAGGIATHFIGISHPARPVWDEQIFQRFSQGYLDGRYFFDVHPPLGWLLMSSSLRAAGAPAPLDFDFETYAPYPPSYPYVASRFLPALAGAFLPLIIFLLARALGMSERASLLAGAFVLLENALLAYSRLAMIDIFLHFFIFTAFLCFLVHRKAEPYSRRWWGFLLLAGFLGGCALSLKWSGLGAIGVMGTAAVIEAVERKTWRPAVIRAAVLGSLAVAVYVPLFALHFHLLPKAGPGDVFMTPEFRAGIEGTLESKRPEIPPLGFAGRFVELNRKMYEVHTTLSFAHPEGSRWYEWPVGRRPIAFWADADDPRKRIVLTGNPFVWGFATLSALGAIAFAVVRRSRIRELMASDPAWRERTAALEFLLIAWVVFLLPFGSISRGMFLYHYFTAYLAAILLGAFLVVDLAPAVGWRGGVRGGTLGARGFRVLLILAAAAFLFVAPVTFGFRPPLPFQSDLLPDGPKR